jgi:hypothetical protein
MGDLEPYDRRDFAGALAANAATRPFNLAVLVATTAAAGLVGASTPLALAVAVLVYVLACVRTFFDSDEADRVLAEERRRRRERLAAAVKPLELDALAPPIREHVVAARRRERQIRDAIDRAELPYEEVTTEVDGFVRAMEKTASRAQLLYEALRDSPPEAVERRLRAVQAERDPARRELVDALEHQLHVQRRMETQLRRFYDEMERMVVELDTVRGSLLSASVAEGASAQRELAGEVRGLRERMGAVSDGLAEAFEETA